MGYVPLARRSVSAGSSETWKLLICTSRSAIGYVEHPFISVVPGHRFPYWRSSYAVWRKDGRVRARVRCSGPARHSAAHRCEFRQYFRRARPFLHGAVLLPGGLPVGFVADFHRSFGKFGRAQRHVDGRRLRHQHARQHHRRHGHRLRLDSFVSHIPDSAGMDRGGV